VASFRDATALGVLPNIEPVEVRIAVFGFHGEDVRIEFARPDQPRRVDRGFSLLGERPTPIWLGLDRRRP
jgi:hypothetical protein